MNNANEFKRNHVFIVKTFNAKKTLYGDDGRSVIGYDGEEELSMHLFAKESQRDEYLEKLREWYGEKGDGSDCELLFSGKIAKFIFPRAEDEERVQQRRASGGLTQLTLSRWGFR